MNMVWSTYPAASCSRGPSVISVELDDDGDGDTDSSQWVGQDTRRRIWKHSSLHEFTRCYRRKTVRDVAGICSRLKQETRMCRRDETMKEQSIWVSKSIGQIHQSQVAMSRIYELAQVQKLKKNVQVTVLQWHNDCIKYSTTRYDMK